MATHCCEIASSANETASSNFSLQVANVTDKHGEEGSESERSNSSPSVNQPITSERLKQEQGARAGEDVLPYDDTSFGFRGLQQAFQSLVRLHRGEEQETIGYGIALQVTNATINTFCVLVSAQTASSTDALQSLRMSMEGVEELEARLDPQILLVSYPQQGFHLVGIDVFNASVDFSEALKRTSLSCDKPAGGIKDNGAVAICGFRHGQRSLAVAGVEQVSQSHVVLHKALEAHPCSVLVVGDEVTAMALGSDGTDRTLLLLHMSDLKQVVASLDASLPLFSRTLSFTPESSAATGAEKSQSCQPDMDRARKPRASCELVPCLELPSMQKTMGGSRAGNEDKQPAQDKAEKQEGEGGKDGLSEDRHAAEQGSPPDLPAAAAEGLSEGGEGGEESIRRMLESVAEVDDVSTLNMLLLHFLKLSTESKVILTRIDQICSHGQELSRSLEQTCVLLLQLMDRHADDADVQALCCSILSALSCEKSFQEHIAASGGAQHVLKAMTLHPDALNVQLKSSRALCNLAYENGDIQEDMARSGGVGMILLAMRRHASKARIQVEGCGALCNLCANKAENLKLILEEGGLEAILQAMSLHVSDQDVLFRGCCALSSFASSHQLDKELSEGGAVSVVIKCLLVFPDNEDLVYKGCSVLADVCEGEPCLKTCSRLGAIPAVLKALAGKCENVRLQSKGMRLLLLLCGDGENHQQLIRYEGIGHVLKVMETLRGSGEIQERGCAILNRLARVGDALDMVIEHNGVQIIVTAMLDLDGNINVLEEGLSCLSRLCLNPTAKEELLQTKLIEFIRSAIESNKLPKTCRMSIVRIVQAIAGLDEVFSSALRNIGEHRPISAILPPSMPRTPFRANAASEERRPASATFSGSGAKLVKELRMRHGDNENVDRNLLLEHQISHLAREAEVIRNENLKIIQQCTLDGRKEELLYPPKGKKFLHSWMGRTGGKKAKKAT
mmetsp:Transcript_23973/g.77940  ORF Transcript_23973/g.77940 Transcript_23973/m.77940 type:complete len:960 (+) Transcript_23973:633-3512(+)